MEQHALIKEGQGSFTEIAANAGLTGEEECVLRMRYGIGVDSGEVLGSKLDQVPALLRHDVAADVMDIERRAVDKLRSRTPSAAAIAMMMRGRGARPDPIDDAVIAECYLGPNGPE